MLPAIFGLSGHTLTADERAFFRDADPTGYILFARNVADRDQLRALTDDLRSIHGRDQLLVTVDHEGGRVARLKPPVWSRYPAGEAFARLWQLAPASAIEAARVHAQALGMDLAEVGISMDCWPCVDVRVPGADDVIGDRALGEEPRQVAALGRAILDGLALAGVAGCVKHMPGHGRAGADSHKALPRVEVDAAALEQDLAPFRALNKAPAGMTAHILYPAWDAERPATQSPTIIQQIIRENIGFDGLLMSDDLDMKALTGTIAEKASLSLAAGCDVVLNCWGTIADMQAIAGAVPALTEQGAARLERALADDRGPRPLDAALQAELWAKRDALLALAGADLAAGADPTAYTV
ncbi:beta-N-acetylhexosaminidase [Novosphingobium terrae]|uniref:beta-N-acetylhexosaminidase n=1 Tax=Novosphingobium terrae TaxID=2726189 RepID=UPI00197F4961|nr:beta-N-acetylhexosaminidase [Novosphingobium terrae]